MAAELLQRSMDTGPYPTEYVNGQGRKDGLIYNPLSDCLLTPEEDLRRIKAEDAEDHKTVHFLETIGRARVAVHRRADQLQLRWDYCWPILVGGGCGWLLNFF